MLMLHQAVFVLLETELGTAAQEYQACVAASLEAQSQASRGFCLDLGPHPEQMQPNLASYDMARCAALTKFRAVLY